MSPSLPKWSAQRTFSDQRKKSLTYNRASVRNKLITLGPQTDRERPEPAGFNWGYVLFHEKTCGDV